jgi:hypothetical protein
MKIDQQRRTPSVAQLLEPCGKRRVVRLVDLLDTRGELGQRHAPPPQLAQSGRRARHESEAAARAAACRVAHAPLAAPRRPCPSRYRPARG